MQIIKDKKIIEDTWSYVPDDAGLIAGDICVSLSRWKQDKQQLLAHKGGLGIRIGSADVIDDIAPDLKDIQLIELDFSDFSDGRLFSHAWLLRGRYNYQGELRATGRYIPDQVFYLSRVGVNAFYLEKVEDLMLVLSYLNDFTVKYQSSIN
jgi:uncharacterized protein (DUF934 family)